MFCAIFWGVRSFSKLFVWQYNNTISGTKSTIQPLTWWIIPSGVAPGLDFTVVRYFVLILYGSMFLTMKSPTINNLFVIRLDSCDVFLHSSWCSCLHPMKQNYCQKGLCLMVTSNKSFGCHNRVVSWIVRSFLCHV